MTDFNAELSALCSKAMKEAKGDMEAQAEIVERLVNAIAFTIAMSTNGHQKTMQMLLAGAEQHMYEAAAGHGATVRALGL